MVVYSPILIGEEPEFITLQRGFDLPVQKRSEGSYPVLAATSTTDYHNEYKVQAPGVVTGRSGSLGTVQYIDQPFWPLNTTLWVKDFKGNMPRYVYYYLQTLDLNRFNSGTGVPTLNRNDLDSLEIIIHNPEGQTKVATILATYDDLIENNNRRIKILEEMAQMIYREWFVHFRFPGHENVKMVDYPLGMIPEGWSHSCVGDLATERKNTVNPKDLNPTTPYVGLEHIPRRSITLDKWGTASDAHSTKFEFKRGDILFGKIRPYFHKVVFAPEEGICSTDTIVISASDDKYFPLLLMLTSSETFVDYASQTSQGTKMPRANWGVLKKYPIIIPENSLLGRFNPHSAHSRPRQNSLSGHVEPHQVSVYGRWGQVPCSPSKHQENRFPLNLGA